MSPAWLKPDPGALVGVTLTAVVIYLTLIVLVRIVGLRTFSKMSSFDFAITVAVGSVIASTVSARTPPLIQGAYTIAVLFGLQFVVAKLRERSRSIESLVDNQPLLVMYGGRFLDDNMRTGRMTRADLIAKLREANVLDLKEVRAVVMETTGDVSVLHGDPEAGELSPELLEGVRGMEAIHGQGGASAAA